MITQRFIVLFSISLATLRTIIRFNCGAIRTVHLPPRFRLQNRHAGPYPTFRVSQKIKGVPLTILGLIVVLHLQAGYIGSHIINPISGCTHSTSQNSDFRPYQWNRSKSRKIVPAPQVLGSAVLWENSWALAPCSDSSPKTFRRLTRLLFSLGKLPISQETTSKRRATLAFNFVPG